MKLAAPEEQTEFLEEYGFEQLLDADDMPGRHRLHYSFEREDHTQSVFILANLIEGFSNGSKRTLVVLDNMYVWRSGRDEFLIQQVLQGLVDGHAEPLGDRSMLLWEASEQDAAKTLYHLALLFGWDAYIYPSAGTKSAFISHDGFIELRTDESPKALAEHAEAETTRQFQITSD